MEGTIQSVRMEQKILTGSHKLATRRGHVGIIQLGISTHSYNNYHFKYVSRSLVLIRTYLILVLVTCP